MQDSPRNDIEIETPCPKTWDSLVGDDQRRFCSECALHVHNSAALTRAEVRELVEGASERVCMRIVRGPDGAPRYLDSCDPAADPREARRPIRALPRAAGWILAAGAGLMSACEDSKPPVAPPPHGGEVIDVTTMGIVAPPPPEQPTVPLEALGEVAFPVEGQDGTELPDCSSNGGESDDADVHAEMLGRVAPVEGIPGDRD